MDKPRTHELPANISVAKAKSLGNLCQVATAFTGTHTEKVALELIDLIEAAKTVDEIRAAVNSDIAQVKLSADHAQNERARIKLIRQAMIDLRNVLKNIGITDLVNEVEAETDSLNGLTKISDVQLRNIVEQMIQSEQLPSLDSANVDFTLEYCTEILRNNGYEVTIADIISVFNLTIVDKPNLVDLIPAADTSEGKTDNKAAGKSQTIDERIKLQAKLLAELDFELKKHALKLGKLDIEAPEFDELLNIYIDLARKLNYIKKVLGIDT